MVKKRPSLTSPRAKAFKLQKGLCYYCNFPMWNDNPDEFSKRYFIKPKNVHYFKCTGEHLVPHSEGGPARGENIVAACAFCNFRRHRGRKCVPCPEQYRLLVTKRVREGRWHLSSRTTLLS